MRKYIAVFTLFISVLLLMWSVSPAKELAERRPVEVHRCGYRDISTSAYFTGALENIAETSVALSDAAQIASVHVKVGDRVATGDRLFTGSSAPDKFTLSAPQDIVSALKALTGGSAGTESITYTSSESGDYTVYSPVDGVITALGVSKNAVVGAGVPCLVIADTSKLQLRAQVPEEYIQDISEGLDCKITGSAFKGAVYTGKIVQIMPYATTGSVLTGGGETVVEVIMSVDDADERLMAGYSARAEVCTKSVKYTLTVPYSAVQQDGDGCEYVYRLENNRAVRQNITTGIELTDTVQVTQGLRVNDLVILDSDGVEDGMGVRVL